MAINQSLFRMPTGLFCWWNSFVPISRIDYHLLKKSVQLFATALPKVPQ